MVPKLEAEKPRLVRRRKWRLRLRRATIKEAEVMEMKAIEKIRRGRACSSPPRPPSSRLQEGFGRAEEPQSPPAGIDVTGAIYLLHDGGKIDVSWKASQGMMKDVNAFDTLLTTRTGRLAVPKKTLEHPSVDCKGAL